MLQEKIDDLEKEKKEWDAKLTKEKNNQERQLKHGFQKLIEQKQTEINKLNE